MSAFNNVMSTRLQLGLQSAISLLRYSYSRLLETNIYSLTHYRRLAFPYKAVTECVAVSQTRS